MLSTSSVQVLKYVSRCNICIPLQWTALRCYNRQKPPLHARRWKQPKEPIPIVDPKLFKLGDSVSGSITISEDLAELYKQPYELSVSQLTKNGYLRLQKPYKPTNDVQEKLVSIVKSINPKLKDSSISELLHCKLDDIKFKFNLLSKAHEKLEHRVPNSLLHLLETIGDVIQFYKTPIETTTPYEELSRSKDLPPNLHIQQEPIRFLPETDTAFGGITAYPKTTTIVPGLRAKTKFKGQQFKLPWPHA